MIRTLDHGLVYYRFAALGVAEGLRHGFFTRLGGDSQPPFASLNVGATVGDDPGAVAANRRRCFSALGFAETQIITPHQVHSTIVATVTAAQGGQTIPATDGLLSAERGLALFLRFADCVPLLLYDRERPAVGLIHAGWRGALDGIVAQAVEAMQAHFGSAPNRLWAGIGPAIGPCCYEVGHDLAGRFGQRFGRQVLGEIDTGNPHLDLAGAVAAALHEAGVQEIEQAHLCTACHCDEFYSHRREHGQTGRFAALVALM